MLTGRSIPIPPPTSASSKLPWNSVPQWFVSCWWLSRLDWNEFQPKIHAAHPEQTPCWRCSRWACPFASQFSTHGSSTCQRSQQGLVILVQNTDQHDRWPLLLSLTGWLDIYMHTPEMDAVLRIAYLSSCLVGTLKLQVMNFTIHLAMIPNDFEHQSGGASPRLPRLEPYRALRIASE